MITVDQYFSGRKEKYASEYNDEIGENAVKTVEIANKLIAELERFGVEVPINPDGDFAGTQLNSGWRPPTVNAGTKGASPTSMHMTGEAVDIHDPNGEIDDWLMTPQGQFTIEQLGVWMEAPSATPEWSHWQIRSPKSGNRVFIP